MGSLVMHIAASKIVKEKYNLSDKFMAGCIMPDIKSKCGINRNKAHFTDAIDSFVPNISKFIKKHEKELKDELVLGYLAHLIEDKIWFDKYVTKYEELLNENQSDFLAYTSTHTDEKNIDDILYKDYNCIDHYICRKYNISIEEYKNNTFKYLKDDNEKEKINEFLHLYVYNKNRKNFFITQDSADEFIVLSSKEVEKIMKKMIL